MRAAPRLADAVEAKMGPAMSNTSDHELTTRAMLADEAEKVCGRAVDPNDKQFYAALGRLGTSALCLSGGGIRSAAFAVGVIQALAVHPRPAQGQKAGAAKE